MRDKEDKEMMKKREDVGIREGEKPWEDGKRKKREGKEYKSVMVSG